MNKIRTTVSTPPIWEVEDFYEKTHLELAFQREGGFERDGGWSDENGREFLSAIQKGTVTPDITLAEIRSSHLRCKQDGLKNDENYFRELEEKGCEYVSVDGNNSSSYINAFLVNNIAIPNGNDPPFLKNSSFLRELSETDTRILLGRQVTLTIIRHATRAEITEYFQNKNKGTHLNAQELRNGTLTQLAEDVREIRNNKDYDPMFNACFGTRARGKRFDDEFTVKCLNNLENDFKKSNGKKELDNLYREKKTSKKFGQLKHIFADMAKGNQDIFGNKIYPALFSTGMLHQYFFYIYEIKKKYEIKNHKEVTEFFLKKHEEELQKAKKVLEGDRPKHSYSYWVIEHHTEQDYNEERFGRIRTWMGSAGFKIKGWVTPKRKRSFSLKEKKEVCAGQGWKDVFTGKKISIGDFPDYEVDHKTPLTRGGSNESENLQLLSKSDNRAKGINTMEEYKAIKCGK